jgi:hypothetical protein
MTLWFNDNPFQEYLQLDCVMEVIKTVHAGIEVGMDGTCYS